MPAKPYLVFALPRSRTLWLSNALTYGPSVCFHDLCIYGIPAIAHALASGPSVGVADTGIIRLVEHMGALKHLPAVVIHRDPGDVYRALQRVGVTEATHVDLCDQARRLRELERYWDGPVLHVEFEHIDSRGHEIWEHCVGGVLDLGRWTRLCDMKVEVFVDRERERYEERHAQLPAHSQKH